MNMLEKKVAIVTDAIVGIGYVTDRILAREGGRTLVVIDGGVSINRV